MTPVDPLQPLPPPSFHLDSEALRFWVRTADAQAMGASVSKTVLHHRFQGNTDGSDALAIYLAHRPEIDAAVVRRAAAGAREPIMLREHDLPRAPR